MFKRNLSRNLPKLTKIPIVHYDNASLQKNLIFKENVNKSFIYKWTNKLNGKEYIGSTSNAKRRLLTYYDINSLKKTNMPIYKALLKYGHSNFSFEIIEYCNSAEQIEREQYYLDQYDFEYNVLEKANSILGYKHTKKTLAKMKGRKNALGYKHTQETIIKLRDSQKNKKHTEESIKKMKEAWVQRKINKHLSSIILIPNKTSTEASVWATPLLESAKLSQESVNNLNEKIRTKIKGQLVIITNINTNAITEYISITEAALALNINRSTLRSYAKNKTVFNILKQKQSLRRKWIF
jgi:group I intron endonuclease